MECFSLERKQWEVSSWKVNNGRLQVGTKTMGGFRLERKQWEVSGWNENIWGQLQLKKWRVPLGLRSMEDSVGNEINGGFS